MNINYFASLLLNAPTCITLLKRNRFDYVMQVSQGIWLPSQLVDIGLGFIGVACMY